MAFPWHMRTFTPDEKDLRRSALDFFGILGVFSTLILATAVVCWFGHVYRYNFVSGRDGSHRKSLYERWARFLYLSDWYLSQPLARARWMGRRKPWLLGGLWSVFLSYMIATSTGDDYFHLTKRLGHTAASFLPAQYLLSSRFILQRTAILSYQTHETLNKAHRWLGRTIYVLVTLHGALYINYFIRADRLDRFFAQDALFGITGLLIMNAIFLTSLPTYRRHNYKFFFSVHQLLSILILPVAWFHIHYIRRYVLIAGTIYVIDLVGRSLLTREVKMKITHVSSTALDLRGTADWLVSTGNEANVKIPAGSHYYVYVPSMPRSRGNPFTLSSADEKDGEVKFLVRIRDGFTRELRDLADNSVNMTLEGPYGIAAASVGFGCFDGFLFVCGGIGITMTLSVLKELIMQIEDGMKDEDGVKSSRARIKFVWAVGSTEDAAWPVSELLKAGSMSCKPDVDIFVSTGTKEEEEEEEEGEGEGGGRASVELEDLVEDSHQSLLPITEPHDAASGPKLQREEGDAAVTAAAIESLRYRYARTDITPSIRTGRPNLTRATDDFCREMRGGRIAVFVCGPEGMGVDVRKGLEGHYGETLIWLWDEKFGM